MKKLAVLIMVTGLNAMALQPAYKNFSQLEPPYFEILEHGKVLSSVEILPGAKTYRCQLIGLVPAPADFVWKLISEYSRYHEFMPRTPVTFLVPSQVVSSWRGNKLPSWKRFEEILMAEKVEESFENPVYFYNRFDLPFPLKDRQYVLEVMRNPGLYRIEWIEILGNTRVNKGSWQLFVPDNRPGMTIVVYCLDIDLGIILPQKIIQLGMNKLPEIMNAFKQHVIQEKQTAAPRGK